MAKTQTTFVPPTDFKFEYNPGAPTDAFSAVGEAGREGKVFRVPLDAIHPVAGFNIRIHDADYEAHVESIKKSIIDNGFFQYRPLKVFVNKEGDQDLFMLADGYTRYEAAKRAAAEGTDITRLPVVPVPKGTSFDDLLIGLDADNDSRPLTAYEKGILVKRLQASGNDEEEIASAMRITKQYVNDLLGVMACPKPVHNMILGGEVATQLVIELLKEHGSGKKVADVLKEAGATGEAPTSRGAPAARVTRSTVANTGGTAKAGKKLYEALIEYLIVTGKTSGAQAAYDFLLRWHEKDSDAMKELAKIAKSGKTTEKKKKKEKNPKDVRIKITDDMTDEQKKEARAHNKEVKARKERREKREAKKLAGAEPEPV